MGKREREEDRKALAALRAKSEHVTHEIRKREQEIARLKDQLKKNNEKVACKNSFEVYQNLPPRAPTKEGSAADRFAFLLERNERELSSAAQENTLLREKIGEVREALAELSRWVECEVFGEAAGQRAEERFPLEHHLLVGKEALSRHLHALIEATKDGILQLREICRRRSPSRRTEEPPEELSFKRKVSCREEGRADRIIRCEPVKQREGKAKVAAGKKVDPAPNENQTPRSSQELPSAGLRTQPNCKLPLRHHKASLTDLKKTPLLFTPRAARKADEVSAEGVLEEDLSEVCSHDSSIISHISIEQMGKGRYDRWDILYQEEE